MYYQKRMITTGEDYAVLVHLKTQHGAAYTDISDVSACFVTKNRAATINGSMTAQSNTDNADWAVGTIEVVLPATETNAYKEGVYYMQLNITETGGKVRKVLIPEDFTIRSAT